MGADRGRDGGPEGDAGQAGGPGRVEAPTALYRLYDEEGALLYVGITRNLGTRITAHQRVQPWWGEVARVEPEMHLNRATARSAELVAIRDERPRYNVADVTPPPSPPPAVEDEGEPVRTGVAARRLGVHPKTVARWTAEGVVSPSFRTAGGHHRWVMSELVRQLRDAGIEVRDPTE